MPIRATPMLLSPATSICNTVPGLGATLVLIPKTAWGFAGFGGLLEIGITTGRYTSPQNIKIRLPTNIAGKHPPKNQNQHRHQHCGEPAHTSKTHRHSEEKIVVRNRNQVL